MYYCRVFKFILGLLSALSFILQNCAKMPKKCPRTKSIPKKWTISIWQSFLKIKIKPLSLTFFGKEFLGKYCVDRHVLEVVDGLLPLGVILVTLLQVQQDTVNCPTWRFWIRLILYLTRYKTYYSNQTIIPSLNVDQSSS